jgi:hypothetical protein
MTAVLAVGNRRSNPTRVRVTLDVFENREGNRSSAEDDATESDLHRVAERNRTTISGHTADGRVQRRAELLHWRPGVADRAF